MDTLTLTSIIAALVSVFTGGMAIGMSLQRALTQRR